MSDDSRRITSEYELLPVWSGRGVPGSRAAWIWFLGGCLCSVGVYLLVFGSLKFPYSVGIYERMLEVKRSHFERSDPPRLILIAGSNARVSHSARVIEEEIGFPVTNGGLSAAVSTAFALESYKPLLRAGDFCYLPLEYEPLLEYTRDQHLDLKFAMGYDRSRLSGYGFTDQVKGYFGYELGDVFQSLGEQIVVHQMKAYSSREEIDDRGDQVAYDREKATRFRDAVAGLKCPDVPGSEVFEEPPEMLVELGRFLDWCAQHDVKVIGGLPTTFEDTEIPDTLIDGLRGFYESRGHDFLSLPDRSCYPRADFYDSKYHLLPEPAVEHSRVIAQGLKRLIHSSREEARDR